MKKFALAILFITGVLYLKNREVNSIREFYRIDSED